MNCDSSNCIEIVKIHGVLLSVPRCVCTCTSLEAMVLIIKKHLTRDYVTFAEQRPLVGSGGDHGIMAHQEQKVETVEIAQPGSVQS